MRGLLLALSDQRGGIAAAALAITVAAYIGWKITESPSQAVQFAFNGLSVGAVYALLAMGFTIVYSTVWFFDLYYGAAAAIGAYGVFYLRSKEVAGGLYHVNNPYVNILLAAVAAGVVAWTLHETLFRRLRGRFSARTLFAMEGLLAGGVGVYVGLVVTYTDNLNVMLSPAIGVTAAAGAGWVVYRGCRRIFGGVSPAPFLVIAVAAGAAVGVYCAMAVAGAPGSRLYLSWGLSCLLAGAIGLALYRGLYVYMRQRARSPLIMLVASLGILLSITAAIAIVFQSAPRRSRKPSEASRGQSGVATSRDSTCSPLAWPLAASLGCCSFSRRPHLEGRYGLSATTKRCPRWWASTPRSSSPWYSS